MAAGVVAATLVLATLVSVAFAVAADRQRVLADRRFDDVRALANTLLFDLNDRIETLPGSTDARRRLVETGLQYLDAIARDSNLDPELQAELADGYLRIGDILGNPRRANLGDPEAAIENYEQSLELRRALRESSPRSPRLNIDIARTRMAIGETLSSTPRASESVDVERASLEDLEGIQTP